MQPPRAPPRALPKVVVRMSMVPGGRPQCSQVPRPVWSHEPRGVGVVHQTSASYARARATISRQRGQGPVHGEDTVGHHETEPRVLRLHELRLEVGHVHVLVDEPSGLAEPNAIDDGRVVQPSAMMASSLPRRGSKTPPLASKQAAYRMASSPPRKAATRLSSSRCRA